MAGRLEDLKPGVTVQGIVAGEAVTVVQTDWFGTDALTLTYRRPGGAVADELLYRSHEAGLSIGEAAGRWTFDADGSEFRLAAEARRIQLAYLFDPRLAVHLSVLDPLPHQIQAVYGVMRDQLRWVDRPIRRPSELLAEVLSR